jgi:hypothetical protein
MQKLIVRLMLLFFLTLSLSPGQGFSVDSDTYWNLAQKKTNSSLVERIKALMNRDHTVQTTTQYQPRTNTSSDLYRSIYRTPMVQNSTTQPINRFLTTDTQYLSLRIAPHPITKTITEIDGQATTLFTLGFQHSNSSSRSTQFIPAYQVDKIGFQFIDNSGNIDDYYEALSLVIGDEDFRFDSDGRVTVDLKNLRISAGQSKSIEVGVRIADPDEFPLRNSSFRLRINGVNAYQENTNRLLPVRASGSAISEYVTLHPHVTVYPGGSTSVTTSRVPIYGKNLSGGDAEVLLALKLRANYDDLTVRNLRVSNRFGSSIDSLHTKVELINYQTGQIVDTSRFINGTAEFSLPSRSVLIDRGTQLTLGIKVYFKSSIDTSQQIQLTIRPEDVEVWGIGSGQELSSAAKDLDVDSEIFSITQNAGGGVSNSNEQPHFFPTGEKNSVYWFDVHNNGRGEISLGRLTLKVYPNGVNLVGGGQTSDFALHEVFSGREQNQSAFSTTVLDPQTVRFDATNEIYIPGGSSRTFALRVALEGSGSSDGDSVGIKILGDENLRTGTLNSVRSSGANFIWSDHSGAPHTTGSDDWLSGYLFPGVPTQVFVNKR